MFKHVIKYSLFTALALAGTAHAATGAVPETQEMQTVIIKKLKDPDMMSYAYVFEKMAAFQKLKQQDKIFLRFFAVPKGGVKLSDVQMSLEGEGISVPLAMEPDGTIDLPRSQDAYDKKADVLTNQKPGSLKVHYGPGIKVPESQAFKYRDIMDGVKQSTAMMKEFWSFFFPSFKGASLRYAAPEGQYLLIRSASGEKRVNIDPQRKSIPVELDSDLYDENPDVWVSHQPLKISPFNVTPPKAR